MLIIGLILLLIGAALYHFFRTNPVAEFAAVVCVIIGLICIVIGAVDLLGTHHDAFSRSSWSIHADLLRSSWSVITSRYWG